MATASVDLDACIAAFLDAHHVMTLATAGETAPHAANLFYARDGLTLVWVSDESSRHSVELEQHPQVAATVAPDYPDFPAIRGLQISGRAQRVADPHERARLIALLEARYPFLEQLAAAPVELRAAYARAQVYRLDPTRITYIANTLGFGHKETLDVEPRDLR